MNRYTELIINGVSMDLYSTDSLPLSINKSVNNLDGEITGDYSRASITIPASKTNISVLGTRGTYPFRILVDGSPSFQGLAVARKSNTISNGYEAVKNDYTINLISNNSTWYNLLGDSLLSDFVDIQLTWDDTNVSVGTTTPDGTYDWIFGVIKWREWDVFNGTNYEIKWEEFTPGLLIKPFIVNAFQSIGYTVISDFLDTDFGSKLSMPTPIPKKLSAEFGEAYLDTKVSLSGSIVSTFGADANIPFDVLDIVAPYNPTAYDNVTNFEYTCPLTGYYQVDLSLTFDTTAPASYSWLTLLLQNGTPLTTAIGFGFITTEPRLQYPTDGLPLLATGVVYCLAGDTLSFKTYNADSLYPITITAGSMTITGEAVKEYGMPIDFKYLLKEWQFIEMLLGLKAICNLVFDGDEVNKTVTIEPMDRYIDRYKSPTQVATSTLGYYKDDLKDYSLKIDYAKAGSKEYEDVQGRFDYFYKLDNDPTAEYMEGSSKLGIYEARYPISNSTQPQNTRPLEVPFFAKTIHVSDIQAKFPDTNIVPQFPLIYPKNYILDPTATEADQDYDIEPRLLYFGGRRSLLADSIGDGFIEVNGGFGIRTVPAWFAVNYNDTTGFDPSLSFCDEIAGSNTTIKGLLNTFHLQDIVRHEQGEIRDNYVQFNSIDEHEFSFRIKGVIDSQKYIVQTIEGFNPLTDSSTNFKFYLDLVPTLADSAKIINSMVKGIANLVVT